MSNNLTDIKIDPSDKNTSRKVNRDFNDKNMVIIAVTIICMMYIIFNNDPFIIVSNVVTGLFGIAVGRKKG